METQLTRTLIISIFLTLFSQTAWGSNYKIDCHQVEFYAYEAFFNVNSFRKLTQELTTEIIEKQKGVATASQTEIKESWKAGLSESLDDMEKWANVYRAFCK